MVQSGRVMDSWFSWHGAIVSRNCSIASLTHALILSKMPFICSIMIFPTSQVVQDVYVSVVNICSLKWSYIDFEREAISIPGKEMNNKTD